MPHVVVAVVLVSVAAVLSRYFTLKEKLHVRKYTVILKDGPEQVVFAEDVKMDSEGEHTFLNFLTEQEDSDEYVTVALVPVSNVRCVNSTGEVDNGKD